MAADPILTEDLRLRAQRVLPRFAFDYIEGGAGREQALRRSQEAFRDTCLSPRVLVNSAAPASLGTRFLGHDWAIPFGIAPVGLPGLAWPCADSMLALAAEVARAPMVTATPGTERLEKVREKAPGSSMFQLYVGTSPDITNDLIARAEAAGFDTLVVTADVPRPGKRLRDLRNRFSLPLKLGPGLAMDLLSHPRWSLATARYGAPRLVNLAEYASPGTSASSLAALMARQSSGRLDWKVFEAIRKRWEGALVLKGVMVPEDALHAREAGADAVWVSSHGGRQLDAAPATLTALRQIRTAMPREYPIAVDGGIRCGEDILKALTSGANFVFLGRPFLYAVAALQEAGPRVMFDMLAAELEIAMSMTGYRSVEDTAKAPN